MGRPRISPQPTCHDVVTWRLSRSVCWALPPGPSWDLTCKALLAGKFLKEVVRMGRIIGHEYAGMDIHFGLMTLRFRRPDSTHATIARRPSRANEATS